MSCRTMNDGAMGRQCRGARATVSVLSLMGNLYGGRERRCDLGVPDHAEVSECRRR